MTQSPTATRVSAPVAALTVHTVFGVAAYSMVVTLPVGGVTVGAVLPTVTVSGV